MFMLVKCSGKIDQIGDSKTFVKVYACQVLRQISSDCQLQDMAEHCCGSTFWLYLIVIVGLVLFAGLMSGLTLGLMSLGLVDLEVLMKSGTPQDQKYAAKILPVVKNQHLLLCTLLIGNSLAMEALPIFLDALVTAWGAILISVTLILMFGEILPQAVCSRYGLAVGAAMIPIVRMLVFLFFPITYPISKLLDLLLGKGHVALFRRAELKTLVNLHGNEAGKGGELTRDETTIITGALELTQKTAKDAMTPIAATFCLDVNENLDGKTMHLIMSKGHSRVPVYSGSPANIIGLILVKNLLMAHPNDSLPLRQHATIRKIPRVDENMPLYDILNEFRKGHSHMAAVTKCSKEQLNHKRSKEIKSHIGIRLSSSRHWRKSSELRSIQGALAPMAVVLDIPDDYLSDSGNYVLMKRRSFSGSGTSISRKDNEMILESVSRPKKWERTSEADILDLERLSSKSFPCDEEVIGIITMEDVIEELLQEEILDETDEYIDVHNKIRVNMLRPGEESPISTRSSPFLSAASSPSDSSPCTITSSLSLSHPTTEDADLVSHFQAPETPPVANSSPKVSISSPLSQIIQNGLSPKLDNQSNGNHMPARSSFFRPSCLASLK